MHPAASEIQPLVLRRIADLGMDVQARGRAPRTGGPGASCPPPLRCVQSVVDALVRGAHNHVTTTYYLVAERLRREGKIASAVMDQLDSPLGGAAGFDVPPEGRAPTVLVPRPPPRVGGGGGVPAHHPYGGGAVPILALPTGVAGGAYAGHSGAASAREAPRTVVPAAGASAAAPPASARPATVDPGAGGGAPTRPRTGARATSANTARPAKDRVLVARPPSRGGAPAPRVMDSSQFAAALLQRRAVAGPGAKPAGPMFVSPAWIHTPMDGMGPGGGVGTRRQNCNARAHALPGGTGGTDSTAVEVPSHAPATAAGVPTRPVTRGVTAGGAAPPPSRRGRALRAFANSSDDAATPSFQIGLASPGGGAAVAAAPQAAAVPAAGAVYSSAAAGGAATGGGMAPAPPPGARVPRPPTSAADGDAAGRGGAPRAPRPRPPPSREASADGVMISAATAMRPDALLRELQRVLSLAQVHAARGAAGSAGSDPVHPRARR